MTPIKITLLLAAALLASTIAASTGTGGGVILLPVMTLFFGVPFLVRGWRGTAVEQALQRRRPQVNLCRAAPDHPMDSVGFDPHTTSSRPSHRRFNTSSSWIKSALDRSEGASTLGCE